MKSSWIAGLQPEKAKDVKVNFEEGLVLRKRLSEILLERIADSHKHASSKLLYDNPNWSLLQADQRGYERGLLDIINLLQEN